MSIIHGEALAGNIRLHYVEAGDGPLLVALHGFPEFWYAWRAQLRSLCPDFRVVAPDLPGYNLSGKPQDLACYTLHHLAGTVAQLIEQLDAGPAIVVGHDWGGAIAWRLAACFPEKVARLIVVNAPHPVIFQRELRNNPAQQRASRYMLLLQRADAEERLRENDFAVLRQAMDPAGSALFTESDWAAYRSAWSQSGALAGAVNYYRALLRLPTQEEASELREFPQVAQPALVLWAEEDTALLPGNLEGLEAWVQQLEIVRIPGSSHWVLHEQPEVVSAAIQ
ncbi:MAG: alpha/beta hydrolase, partial [Chloroflexi bacterium]|nr:alpha/beta hydrolase [Chloroflexota bacterium]